MSEEQYMTGVGVAWDGEKYLITQLFWTEHGFTPREAFNHIRQP